MANEIFTRIQLKHDSYANWDAVKNTFKPLPGEICIAEIPTGNAAATTAPTVLFKVGAYKKDASGNNTTELHTFAELPWASALAADVYAWAKKPEAEFIAWAKGLVPVEVIDSGTGKFVTNVTATNDEKGHHITITRSDVDWNDVKNAPDFALVADLGDVSKLNTTAKTAVGAINEHGAEIGDLASLNTTNKGNLVSAINEALQAVEVGGTGSVVTVTKQEIPSEGSEATYVVKQGGNAVDVKIEIPKYDTSADYGILEVAGENAIKVETENQKATAKLVLDNTGNVAFSQSTAGLKAEVTHVAEAGKVDNALTVKLGGTDIVFDGSAAKTADVDSAIQGAKDYAKDLVEAIPAQTDYTVTCEDTEYEEAEGVPAFKRHTLKQNGNTVCTIDIPKELVVEAGSVKEVTEAGKPYDGAVVGDKYIELVIANQDTPIYVPAKDLVDIYTHAKDAKEVQVDISNTNEISATLVNGGVSEAKLAEAVKTKLNKTWTEVKDFNDLSELVTGNN